MEAGTHLLTRSFSRSSPAYTKDSKEYGMLKRKREKKKKKKTISENSNNNTSHVTNTTECVAEHKCITIRIIAAHIECMLYACIDSILPSVFSFALT